MFHEVVGVSLFGGYRIASAPIAYPDSGVFKLVDPAGEKIFKAGSIDLSGPYFGAGVVIAFGAEPSKEKPAAQPARQPAAQQQASELSQHERYGDHYYRNKNFEYAARYYNAALKAEPNNAGLYKKLGLTFYYLKDMAKAKQYMEEYLKRNPNDPQIKQWLGR
mgnify:CR=1 FL=1